MSGDLDCTISQGCRSPCALLGPYAALHTVLKIRIRHSFLRDKVVFFCRLESSAFFHGSRVN